PAGTPAATGHLRALTGPAPAARSGVHSPRPRPTALIACPYGTPHVPRLAGPPAASRGGPDRTRKRRHVAGHPRHGPAHRGGRRGRGQRLPVLRRRLRAARP